MYNFNPSSVFTNYTTFPCPFLTKPYPYFSVLHFFTTSVKTALRMHQRSSP